MAGIGATKLKLLYIKDYLERFSDEQNPVGAEELLEMLEEKGIHCERKAVYSDVQTLRNADLEIFRVKAPKNGYYLATRTFELPELRLLIDAVQAANFITPKKSKELIEKIGTLCSQKQAQQLQKQVFIENRVKNTNEEIYYNIDVINKAIQAGRKISFLYSKRRIDDETHTVTTEEKRFVVSPYALIWSNDHYYLVCNNAKYDNLMHTRIDRMKKVELSNTRVRDYAEVSPYRLFFDAADYAGKLFNMFSGDVQQIEFICHDELLEEILDRFGAGAVITKAGDNEPRFRVQTKGVVSDGLVSWVMQFADKIEVVAPRSLRAQMQQRAEAVLAVYRQSTEPEPAAEEATDDTAPEDAEADA